MGKEKGMKIGLNTPILVESTEENFINVIDANENENMDTLTLDKKAKFKSKEEKTDCKPNSNKLGEKKKTEEIDYGLNEENLSIDITSNQNESAKAAKEHSLEKYEKNIKNDREGATQEDNMLFSNFQ